MIKPSMLHHLPSISPLSFLCSFFLAQKTTHMITNPHSFTNSSNNNTKHPPISTHQHTDISTSGSNSNNNNTSDQNGVSSLCIPTTSSLLLLMIFVVILLISFSFTTLASVDTDPESFRLVSIRKSGIKPSDDGLLPPQDFSWSRFQGPHFSPGGSGRSASRRRNELYSRQEDPYTRYMSNQLRSNRKPQQDVNFYMTRYSPTRGPERLRRN